MVARVSARQSNAPVAVRQDLLIPRNLIPANARISEEASGAASSAAETVGASRPLLVPKLLVLPGTRIGTSVERRGDFSSQPRERLDEALLGKSSVRHRGNRRKRNFLCSIVVLAFIFSTAYVTQAATDRKDGQFNTHELSGVWWVSDPGPDKLMGRAKNGDAGKCETCHISEHTAPEPPLTPWARQHLMIQPVMPGVMAASTDICYPLGVPAQFWYTQLFPFEFVVTPDRILQFFEKQYEWRIIWMNRDHPKHLAPPYMGDSVGRWEGNTLVVDTIGYEGGNLIEPVGVMHRMSGAFHLVERWQRVSPNELDVDITYYDKKVWGERPWGGLKKQFILQPHMELMESPCSPEEDRKFDEQFSKPAALPEFPTQHP